MQILSAVVLLGVLIFVHEFGHFLFAKLLGFSVLKFSLGFGPRIWGFRRGETEYQIAAVPLGGFVKMLGEEPGEELDPAQQDRAFSRQAVWKRMIVVAAGPVFNVAFAAVLFTALILAGVPTPAPVVGKVLEGTPAEGAGLRAGDRITAIDGEPIRYWEDMSVIIHDSPGRELTLGIRRGGESFEIRVTPEAKTVQNVFGEDLEVGLIGISPADETETLTMPLHRAVPWALGKTWQWCELTVLAIVKLIQKVIPADSLGGPILIMQMAGQRAAQGADSFFLFMAVISINLGVLNLFPIPILDGGHLAFMLIETLRGRPLSPRVMEIAQRTGLFIILGIMVFAIYNDLLRVFTGGLAP